MPGQIYGFDHEKYSHEDLKEFAIKLHKRGYSLQLSEETYIGNAPRVLITGSDMNTLKRDLEKLTERGRFEGIVELDFEFENPMFDVSSDSVCQKSLQKN